MGNSARGFTLIELLIVLLVVSTILTQAIPLFGTLVVNAQKRAEAGELISLLNLARNKAISEGQTVTVCAINTEKKCDRDWTNPIVAFRDPDRLRRIDDDQQIIRLFEPAENGKFDANLGIRDYLRFRSSGMAREAIGNIVWCPKNGDAKSAFQLRINMGGRIHHSQDRDGDGVVEGTAGQPISCPG